MKVRDLMTKQVVRIHPEEPVEVAARSLTQYNIGALPVCGRDGQVYGMVTDRDLVTRCIAAGRRPEETTVREIMTSALVTASPDTDAAAAAHLMGQRQIRRLPVLENGRLCGLVSLGDLANRQETASDATGALSGISSNVSVRQ
jgi:CBS domain-containing protein